MRRKRLAVVRMNPRGTTAPIHRDGDPTPPARRSMPRLSRSSPKWDQLLYRTYNQNTTTGGFGPWERGNARGGAYLSGIRPHSVRTDAIERDAFVLPARSFREGQRRVQKRRTSVGRRAFQGLHCPVSEFIDISIRVQYYRIPYDRDDGEERERRVPRPWPIARAKPSPVQISVT